MATLSELFGNPLENIKLLENNDNIVNVIKDGEVVKS